MDRNITLSKHEAVVDRDWLENIGKALLEYASTDEEKRLANECIEIGNNYPEEDEDE
jgi:hypothetical protein